MEHTLHISDVIQSFISGDWGEAENIDNSLVKVACVRGADINDVNGSQFCEIPIRYITASSLLKRGLKEGEIVIEKSGGAPTQSTGRVAYISKEFIEKHPHIVCSNFCEAFTVKPEWEARYIFYYLQYFYNTGVFFNFEGKTSGLHNLDVEQAFKSIPIIKIDIAEQRKAVEILSNIDKKIALNRQINATLEALARQLYDYWFVQFDFPDANGNPYKFSGGKMVYNPQLKREIPIEWKVEKVKEFIEPIERGISYSSEEIASPDGIPMINLACYSKQGDYRTGELKHFSGVVKDNYLVSPFDMFVACTDMTQDADVIGRPILATEEFEHFVYSMDLAKITPKKIAKYYLYYSLRTPFYHNYIKPFASGTNVKHLNIKGIEEYLFVIPSKLMQERFDDIIMPVKKKQMGIINEIKSLTRQRDELLPLLMNGQVTIE